jgi:crossover junction endodeoxyribonuclease RusA
MTTRIVLAISRDVLMTSNQRPHWATKARHTRVVRDMAWVLAKAQRVQLMPAATLEVVTKWSDHRVRDAENIAPTSKAAIDGCVQAGLLTDDSSEYLKSVTFSIDPETHKTPGVACFLTMTFTEVPA